MTWAGALSGPTGKRSSAGSILYEHSTALLIAWAGNANTAPAAEADLA